VTLKRINRDFSIRGTYFDADGGFNDTIKWDSLWSRIELRSGPVGAGVDVEMYITKVGSGAGATYDSGRNLQTDAEGNVTFNFTATCDNASTPLIDEEYEVGVHDWYIQVIDDQLCNDSFSYEDNDYYNFSVTGTLSNAIVFPDGSNNYTTWDSILLQGYVENYCGEPITTLDNNTWFNQSNGAYNVNCTDVTRSGANVYFCNWQPDQQTPLGWYNITMSSIAENYWSNETSELDIFYLTTEPRVFDANVTPRENIWGGNFNFTVKVKDNLNDLVNVSLQTQVIGQGWVDIANSSCTSCSDNPNNYTLIYFEDVNYSCSGHAGSYHKFQLIAEDNEGNTIYTSILNPGDYVDNDDQFYIDYHNITIGYFSGNETTATPSVSAEFILRGYDSNLGSYILNDTLTLAFNVTKTGFGTEAKTVGTANSNSTGHVIYNFYADGDFSEGKQEWKGFVDVTEMCYNFNESALFNVTVVPEKYIYMENSSVNPATGGWGFNFTFNVTSITNSLNNITFNLTIGPTSSGPWTIIDSQNWNVTDQWKTINFTWDPLCANISTQYYRITGDDEVVVTNQTTVQSFVVEKDEVVLVYFWGNDTEARRNSVSTYLVVNKFSLHIFSCKHNR